MHILLMQTLSGSVSLIRRSSILIENFVIGRSVDHSLIHE